MTEKLTILERVVFAHIEYYEGQNGAGLLDRSDPMMERVEEGDWFRRVPVQQITSAGFGEALEELTEELEADSGEESEAHAFAVQEPGAHQIGWVVLLWTEASDVGLMMVDAAGSVVAQLVEPRHIFFEDALVVL